MPSLSLPVTHPSYLLPIPFMPPVKYSLPTPSYLRCYPCYHPTFSKHSESTSQLSTALLITITTSSPRHHRHHRHHRYRRHYHRHPFVLSIILPIRRFCYSHVTSYYCSISKLPHHSPYYSSPWRSATFPIKVYSY